MKKYQRPLAVALMVALVMSVAACSSNKKKGGPIDNGEKSEAQLKAEAALLYKVARRDMDSAEYQSAIAYYDQLSTRYPFTEIATQGEIEKVYALYRNMESDKALAAADRFMRDHPRNPSIDYVLYIKGLTSFYRDPSFSSMLGVSSYLGDVTSDRRAYDDFAMLLQRFPDSRFAGDARERMVFLRNKIALHELSVVKYYVKRGAAIAAAKRAEQIIAQYPGSPATYEALELMEASYRKAGLTQQADDAARVLAGQPAAARESQLAPSTPWYKRLLPGKDEPAEVAPPAAETETERKIEPAPAPDAQSGVKLDLGAQPSPTPAQPVPADQPGATSGTP